MTKPNGWTVGYTPGPWRWNVNPSNKTVHLEGGRPTFDKTVIQFKRWGMSHATVMFNEAVASGEFNIMTAPHEMDGWLVPFSGRDHHASWAMDINHPDARLIAAAPSLYEALKAVVRVADRDTDEFAKARAALSAAGGGV